MHTLYLAIAILAEVAATSTLKASDGFTRPLPTVIVIAGYVTAFYFLSLALRVIPMGVAYAIWSGIGIALVSLTGLLFYRQRLDAAAILGMVLIGAGVVILQLFSKSVPR